jgi:hypothetical protein
MNRNDEKRLAEARASMRRLADTYWQGDNNKSLVLIAAARAIGATLLPDNAAWKNRVQIKSETSSNLYIIAQRKSDGVLACSCRGWIRWRHCKHVDSFKKVLLAATDKTKVVR